MTFDKNEAARRLLQSTCFSQANQGKYIWVNHLTCCMPGCLYHNHYLTCGVCNTAGPWQTPSIYLDICIIVCHWKSFLSLCIIGDWVQLGIFCITWVLIDIYVRCSLIPVWEWKVPTPWKKILRNMKLYRIWRYSPKKVIMRNVTFSWM